MRIVDTNACAAAVRIMRKAEGLMAFIPDPVPKPLALRWDHTRTKRYAKLTQITDGSRRFRWELFTKTGRLVDRGVVSIPEDADRLRRFAAGLRAYLEDGTEP